MNRFYPFLMVTVIISLVKAQSVKEYEIYRTDSAAIAVDGLLNESVWQSVQYTDAFVIYTNGAAGSLTVKAKMLWDERHLYMGFETDDPDIYASYTSQDSHFYKRDDLVEIFIDPDGNGRNYLELGISPKEVYYDFIIINPDENNWEDDTTWDVDNFLARVTVDGTVNNNSDTDVSWTAEIKIPFASLDYPSFGLSLPVSVNDSWRMNLYRIDYDHTTEEWEPNEEYAWSEIGPLSTYPMGFHTPQKFGTVVFSDKQTGTIFNYGNKQVSSGDFSIYQPSSSARYTVFQFHSSDINYVVIHIYNPLGQLIETLWNNVDNRIVWHSQNVPEGIYLCTITGKEGQVTQAITLCK